MSAKSLKRTWALRFKMMMRHTWLIATAGMLLCAGMAAVAYHFFSQPTTLTIAVGPPNSEDARVVQAITQHFARDRASVRLRPIIKDGGTRDTVNALDKGEADLAIVRRDIGMPREGLTIAIWRKNVAVFIVPSAAPPTAANTRAGRRAAAATPPKIEKVENLVGRRLGVVGRSPSNIVLLKAILLQSGIASDKVVILGPGEETKPNVAGMVTVVQFDPSNVGSAIRDAKIKADAILSVGPVSSSITSDAIVASTRGKEAPTFLDLSASEAIVERNPVYESTEIKAGAFGGSPPQPEETIETIGVNHYLVARKRLSEDVAADLTKHLLALRQALATEVPSTAKIEAPDTSKDGPVQVHPGAAAYIDGELKSFFDRYNDLLYYGLMIVSFFGSALAGLMSYTKSDDRLQRMKALERLVEVIAAARTAESIQALDELQSEADKIHGDMVREVEDNSLDETALMAYQVSLEQTRAAISDRRATLLSNPPRPRAAVASV
jgi:TRAP-type uncharacterized transport system substrate-binding protein